MRILTVDDDLYILELLPLIAAKAGFPDVTSTSSAREALKILAATEPAFDCILLDINMPEMNGIELCAEIRRLETYRTTPIIMLTAMSEREYVDKAFKAGATDYATKPFDIIELGARLRVAQELLKARQAAQTAQAALIASPAARILEPSLDTAHAITIDGIKDFVTFDSMVNYLRQMSRSGLAASQLLAMKVDRMEKIYRRANQDEFSFVIGEVARALSETVQISGGLASYSGNGIFFIVSNSASPLIAEFMETHVQDLLDEKNLEYDDGTVVDIEVSFGNPIQPGSGDSSGISALLERAAARANTRSAAKVRQTHKVNIR